MTLARALYLLGYRRTPDQIAKYLQKRGFLHCDTASRRSTHCPVAQYLNDALGLGGPQHPNGYARGGCGGWSIRTGEVLFGDIRPHDVSLGVDSAVAEFVRRYDVGRYRDLENDLVNA